MQNITSKLKEQELAKLQSLLGDNSELTNTFYSAVEKIPFKTIQHNPFASYDAKFFSQFMEYLMAKKLTKHLGNRDLHQLLQANEVSANKLLESLGSQGLSEVIRAFIEKLVETNSISAEQVNALVELITARNTLENQEVAYINDSYKDYLHTQISIKKVSMK